MRKVILKLVRSVCAGSPGPVDGFLAGALIWLIVASVTGVVPAFLMAAAVNLFVLWEEKRGR